MKARIWWHRLAGWLTSSTFRHFKGGRYRLLYVAESCTNLHIGRRIVVYVSLTDGSVYTRDLKEWNESVPLPSGGFVPRFQAECTIF